MINFIKKHYKFIFVLVFFLTIYLYKLGTIPFGIFCDEALIGVRAWEIINGDLSHLIGPFFYQHFNYLLGSLSIYVTIPFVAIFGLNEFSVRLTSVFFALLSLIVLFFLFKKIKTTNILFSIFLLMITPIFFHISRTNFGHLSSFFLLITGYYFYINSVKSNNLFYPIISGVFFGLGLYGYSGFVISTGVLVFFILLTEIIYNKTDWKKYKKTFLLIITFFIFLTPIIYSILFNQSYLIRFEEKSSYLNAFNYKERVIELIKNYPKYYSFNYLFLKGEIGLPGSSITRHSVRGNGIFLTSSLFLLLLSLFFLFKKNELKRYYLPFFMLFLVFPITDIITTNRNVPPYTFSIFSTIIFFPFLINFALYNLNKIKVFNSKLLIRLLFLIALIESIFFLKNYLQYPLYSSDYWGWQSGPKEIISYFISNRNKYDGLYMTGYFNVPEVFLKFYDPKHKCNNCFIGGFDQYNQNKNQLFAIRVEELNKELINKFKILRTIYYPNNQKAFFIGIIKK